MVQGELFGEPQKPLDDICRNRHGGNPESAAANRSIAGSKAATRQQVLEFAQSKGPRGVTADEIAEAWGTSHNHVAPRISELKREGKLIPSNQRRLTRSGCSARVLVAAQV